MDPDYCSVFRVVADIAYVQIVHPGLWSGAVGDVFVVNMSYAAEGPSANHPSVGLIDRHEHGIVVAIVVNIQDVGVEVAVDHARNLVGNGTVDGSEFVATFVGDLRGAVAIDGIEILLSNLCRVLLNSCWVCTVFPSLGGCPVATGHNTSAIRVKADVASHAINIVVAIQQGQIKE